MYKQIVHAWMYAKHPLETILESMVRIGADGIDFTVGDGIHDPKEYLNMDIAKLIQDYGLCIPALTIGYVAQKNDLSNSDPKQRAGAVAFTKLAIDVTAHAGCDRALVSPSWVSEMHQYYAGYDEDWKRAVESIQEAGEYAAKKNIMLLIEPINRYRAGLVRTVSEALKMLADVNLPNVHMVPDTFHMNMEDEDGIPRSLLRAGEHVKCLHVGDNTRRAPGNGTLDWRAIIGALNDIGFDGPLSYELVYNAYNGAEVYKEPEALKAFEAELKAGIDYLRAVMERTN